MWSKVFGDEGCVDIPGIKVLWERYGGSFGKMENDFKRQVN